MTGRERVLATMARQPADRVPADFIHTAEMEERLIRDLKATDSRGLRQRLGIDIVHVKPNIRPGGFGAYYKHWFPKQIEASRFLDNWGITWQRAEMESGDVFYDVVDFPLKQVESVRDIEEYPWPEPARDWDFAVIPSQIQAVAGERLAIAAGTAAVFDDAWRLRGLEQLMVDMAVNPDLVHALLRKVCNYWLEYARLLLEAAGGKVDLMWTYDDLGSQEGMLMSPAMCREFVMPLVKERAQRFKDYGAKVVMHSCGGIYPVIGDIADAGVEVLNPIQPRAKGMDRRRIKQEFGQRLIFHGSVDQQEALVFGSPADVTRETRECLATLGQGGGYILAASHAIEADIPTPNVLAMYDIGIRA